jgi:hypothetical protein
VPDRGAAGRGKTTVASSAGEDNRAWAWERRRERAPGVRSERMGPVHGKPGGRRDIAVEWIRPPAALPCRHLTRGARGAA